MIIVNIQPKDGIFKYKDTELLQKLTVLNYNEMKICFD